VTEPYDLITHRHRLATWAAARAAHRGGTFGIPVEKAFEWIEAVGLCTIVAEPDSLPAPETFDEAHREWRRRLIAAAGPGLSHGKAAKLINVYLKAGVVCAMPGNADDHLRRAVGAIHPPIDSILLKGWGLKSGPWSSFDEDGYDGVIDQLREMVPRPNGFLEFWRLEEQWAGFARKAGG
jgi:hypothetical protein